MRRFSFANVAFWNWPKIFARIKARREFEAMETGSRETHLVFRKDTDPYRAIAKECGFHVEGTH